MTTWSGPTRRSDRFGLVEYHCEHGIGHPALGSALWVAEAINADGGASSWESESIHGCDGCCHDDNFPGGWLQSMQHAHAIIRALNERIANQ